MKYNITPVPKPRQTRADKWKQRPCVMRYRAFADEVLLNKIEIMPGNTIIFTLPMPKTWSKIKKELSEGTAHLQRPDLDNILKSLLDACYSEDSHIWSIGRLEKRWGYTGSIEIY